MRTKQRRWLRGLSYSAGDVELLPDGSEKIWTGPNSWRIRTAEQIQEAATYLAQQLTVDPHLSPAGISPEDYAAAQQIVAGMPVAQAVTQAQQQAGVMRAAVLPPATPALTQPSSTADTSSGGGLPMWVWIAGAAAVLYFFSDGRR